MSPCQKQVIQQLRDEGYAIVCFSPDEVGGVGKDDLESHLVSEGNEHIERLSTGAEEEESTQGQ